MCRLLHRVLETALSSLLSIWEYRCPKEGLECCPLLGFLGSLCPCGWSLVQSQGTSFVLCQDPSVVAWVQFSKIELFWGGTLESLLSAAEVLAS